MMVVPVIAAQAEQLLPVHAHGIGLARVGQSVQLTVHGGESDLHALVLKPAMQILRGDEFAARLERVMNEFLLLGVPLHAVNPPICPSTGHCNMRIRTPHPDAHTSSI